MCHHLGQVLETADSDELNFILAHNNCANLLEVAAEKSVDLLTQGRLQDLTVLSRYAMAHSTPLHMEQASTTSEQ